ncbi:MAG TPA: DUF3311 domain-containing protein [Bacillus bacterium]|uniref:DUF3311 domain-containing protein n=1 Tax=Siminovitchia fordii TaxID=254759 RepID=A0ABQ4K903_9BACI|nr:DUF3311 domain-containing protein [Siminovitchia fordii]GIN22197.1 hypothetical protein J1TS3_33310 [Siminovitchia fordii]HBZ09735.1 DUF3311 domain-containing protein [Bacillus sp. (in: firmicutes)]
MKKRFWLYIFSMIPAIGSLTVINKIEPYVLGMPFVLFWLMLWVVLTSLFLYIVNILDPANEGEDDI